MERRYTFERILRGDRIGAWLVVLAALLMPPPRILAGVQDFLIYDAFSDMI